jgi:putative transposase
LDVKKRFTEEQIIGFLREAQAGLAVAELCRRHGFSEASYYLWRSKFGGMNVSDAKRLKELEAQNGRLKRLLAVDFAYKLSQHFAPILSHLVKDKFGYSVVDKSTSLVCS